MRRNQSLSKRTLLLRRIRAKIRRGDWELTLHARQQSQTRRISPEEIESAILMAYPSTGQRMKVITVYEPSANQWQSGWRQRR